MVGCTTLLNYSSSIDYNAVQFVGPLSDSSRTNTQEEAFVSYEQLWAPWRLDYILDANKSEAPGCFLCRGRDERDDETNLVLSRSERSIVVLNRYPYNNGHLLVAPLNHLATFEDLSDEEICDCARQIKLMTASLTRVMAPHGFNIGLNLGKVAGAGLPGHLHWHIVPRWNGDTNFMPVVGEVTVIPQSLSALYAFLRKDLAAHGADSIAGQ
jgi:ATP adenylyltransferase